MNFARLACWTWCSIASLSFNILSAADGYASWHFHIASSDMTWANGVSEHPASLQRQLCEHAAPLACPWRSGWHDGSRFRCLLGAWGCCCCRSPLDRDRAHRSAPRRPRRRQLRLLLLGRRRSNALCGAALPLPAFRGSCLFLGHELGQCLLVVIRCDEALWCEPATTQATA